MTAQQAEASGSLYCTSLPEQVGHRRAVRVLPEEAALAAVQSDPRAADAVHAEQTRYRSTQCTCFEHHMYVYVCMCGVERGCVRTKEIAALVDRLDAREPRAAAETLAPLARLGPRGLKGELEAVAEASRVRVLPAAVAVTRVRCSQTRTQPVDSTVQYIQCSGGYEYKQLEKKHTCCTPRGNSCAHNCRCV